ncbi:MAG: amidase domain-containing protein [Clostridiaceae bacterium]|nr:amidase domain-containing protein [Clostridiales bacterium]MDD6876949.1 amidase domain-containing protein [Clostridiaceae bacterium]MDY3072829.1 amidase domain-containing protein [Eubacteriales bacterium]MDY3285146.1 amidase domain-containing protein [Eubacteriales bacterium]MDY5016799.1 amidase domain-containing protein [Eubacteriales bacterium]
MIEFAYNREKAVAYAHQWAYRRNPAFLDFQELGGDCTNYASQCIFAGAGIMNYTPVYGWYYINGNNRTASWTGVVYLYNFLTQNEGVGPYAREVDITEIQPGDVCQLALDRDTFHHTPVIVKTGLVPDFSNVLVAAHSRDVDCRPLDTYSFRKVRFLHIEGVRTIVNPQ